MFHNLLYKVIVTCCLVSITNIALPNHYKLTIAQNAPSDELSYDFFGRSIPLTHRQDIVAVKFNQTNSRSLSNQPLYLQLKQDLEQGIRGPGDDGYSVSPLGLKYALIKLPDGISSTNKTEQQARSLDYVEETLPVLTRSDRQEIIILPNEIILTFASDSPSPETVEQFLRKNDLKLIRPLPFTDNEYLVSSQKVFGTEILSLVKQLEDLPEITSASPNFFTQFQYPPIQQIQKKTLEQSETHSRQLQGNNLLPLQWHLDVMRVEEAWRDSNQGEGVVVAVIDSIIQWDHPNLGKSIHQVEDIPDDEFPNENYGWDFSENDNDTRISPEELDLLKPKFQDMLILTNSEFSNRYNQNQMEFYDRVIKIFHGTSVTGVIAANSDNGNGISGIAPKAKILPIRIALASNLQPSVYSQDAFISALRYAASRGADIINMSIGGGPPTKKRQQVITEILENNPNLIIVASAGNAETDLINYPSEYPGVLSVGAINIKGYRSSYSNYGYQVDITAPGGDISDWSNLSQQGILTTGGTWIEPLWQGLTQPISPWGLNLDPLGKYIYIDGTSFSSPAIAGVLALMRSEDPDGNLDREEMINILIKTSTYKNLNISDEEQNIYEERKPLLDWFINHFSVNPPVGNFPLKIPNSPERYFFGNGLVNAEAAVRQVQQQR